MTLAIGLENTRRLTYPELPSLGIGSTWNDYFNRSLLNEANSYTMYTVSLGGTGGGSGLTNATRTLRLITDGGSGGDDVDVRSNGFSVNRMGTDENGASVFNPANVVEMEYAFGNTSTTNMELFFGLVDGSESALGTLPVNTQRHMGIMIDTSGSNNWFFTSADGTTLATADTSVAGNNATRRRVVIRWSGNDAATIQFFSGVTDTSPAITATLTTLDSDFRSYIFHAFAQTEESVAKTTNLFYWGVRTFR